MARVNEGSHILPATHTFIHEWNEPSCLYLNSTNQLMLMVRNVKQMQQQMRRTAGR